jgi:DNA-binding NarL/FixJ family response regulator
MAVINSPQDLSSAIEIVLSEIKDKNKCPKLEDSFIEQLQAAKSWLDKNTLEQSLKKLRDEYKELVKENLNYKVNNLNKGKGEIQLSEFLLDLLFLTVRMHDYKIPNYAEILKEVMGKITNENREEAKFYYNDVDKKQNQYIQLIEKHAQGKKLNPDDFRTCVEALSKAANSVKA